jgi:hypothetical protein
MKKLTFTFLILGIASLLTAQNVVTLDLQDPCDFEGVETNNSNDVFSLTVHPNPAKDFVTLSIETKEPVGKAVLKIYDANGKCVLREQFFSANTKCIKQMNIGAIKPGTYTILLQNDKGKASSKLIIN